MSRTAGIVVTGLMVIAGAAGAVAAVGTEEGKTIGKAPAGSFGLKRFDSNQDQAISVDEFLKRRVEAFSKLDKSGDGALDVAELDRAPLGNRPQRRDRGGEQMLARLDGNADGKLTKAEFDAAPTGGNGTRSGRAAERRQLIFTFYDRNGDGIVEKAEFVAGRAEETEFRKRRRMHALDRDGDGKVTLEEYTADARFRFMRLDIDRDGRVTAADLPPIERQRWSQR